MKIFYIFILAIVQGLAELLPISSSGHVIVAEKLMGLDPSSPEMTLLLVMLHTGTMLAVIVYFWKRWRLSFFTSFMTFKTLALRSLLATLMTGFVGGGLIEAIERWWLRGYSHAEVESLFGHLEIIAIGLAFAGLLILISGLSEKRRAVNSLGSTIDTKQAWLIGTTQGLCLPFRGFSRSGSTISVGIMAGVPKGVAEEFSFILAIILTPIADAREIFRLMRSQQLETT